MAAFFSGLYKADIIEFLNVPYTEWADLLSQHDCFRIKHENDDELGYEQVYKLREGLILRILDLSILRDSRVQVKTLADHFSCFFNITGDVVIVEEAGDERPMGQGGCGISYDSNSRLFEDFSQAGNGYVFVEVLISKALLSELFFDGVITTMPQVIRPLYNEQRPLLYHPLRMDSVVYRAIEVLAASDYDGKLRQQFLTAKATELVCLMMRLLQRQEKTVARNPLSARDITLLEQAKALLIADLSAPPTIDQLSQQLGIGKSALLQRFKQFFGMSLRQYVLQARMDSARELLNQNDLDINHISWQLGYEHACNFVTAFKRHYGLTPKAYRQLDVKR